MNHARATTWILSLREAVGINIWYVSSVLIPCIDNIHILYLWPFCHLDIGCVKGRARESRIRARCISTWQVTKMIRCHSTSVSFHVNILLKIPQICNIWSSVWEDPASVFLYLTLWMRLFRSYTRPVPSVLLFICFRSCPLSLYLSDMMRVILTSREPRAARTDDLSV